MRVIRGRMGEGDAGLRSSPWALMVAEETRLRGRDGGGRKARAVGFASNGAREARWRGGFSTVGFGSGGGEGKERASTAARWSGPYGPGRVEKGGGLGRFGPKEVL